MQLLKNRAGAGGHDCLLCGQGGAANLLCEPCEDRLPRCAPDAAGGLVAGAAFDHALAAFHYRFPIDRLVHRFKFAGDLAVGLWLSGQLASRVRPLPRPACIVAPPLTAASLRRRGFNQALEVAKVVGRAVGAPVDRGALVKVRETPPQPLLDARERRRNQRGVFECRRVFHGEHVAIVDDVLTTGATCEAMARALKDAGAGSVSAWAIALAGGAR